MKFTDVYVVKEIRRSCSNCFHRLQPSFLMKAGIGILLFVPVFLAAVFPPLSTAQTNGNTLDKVLNCAKPGEAGGIAGGTDLYRINLDTSKFPEAICNDGTGGVFYVRRYAKVEDRDKWVIYLQGGGNCGRGQECAERWCSIGTNFGANKMSTSFAPERGIRGSGILNPDTNLNNFASWNQVFIYYCSSDEWSGTARNVQLTATGVNGQTISYTIHFKGASIIDAVISLLRKENKAKVKYKDSTGKNLTMPDLDDAGTVVFAGASAGSNGVRHNTDRLHTLLRQNNTKCTGATCPLAFFTVIDSGYSPDLAKLDFSKTTFCTLASLCTYDSYVQRQLDVVQRDTWGARSDESCLEYHKKDGTERFCADLNHVMEHHLTSPYFVRQDLQDKLQSGNYADAGLTDAVTYGQIVHEQLTNLVNLNMFAEEGSVRSGGPALKTPGVFGAQCTGHETLASNPDFFDVKVVQNGKAYNAHDVLWNWIRGQTPAVVIRPFTGTPGAAPECPPEK